jgi:hypothetical protein
MRRVLVALVFAAASCAWLTCDVEAQSWNPFRSAASVDTRANATGKPDASPQASRWPQWNLPKLQSPFAPLPPGSPTMAQRFNNSTQRFFTKTKEVVTAPIDAMSQKTSEMSQWMQRTGAQSPSSSGGGNERSSQETVSSGPPQTVNEWLAQERP